MEIKRTFITVYLCIFFSFKEDIYLYTIGIVHKKALKKSDKTSILNKQEYSLIPLSFLAFFIGLVDGDGYIQITKTTKGYIAIKLVICLQLADLSTLEYINSVLKLGKISINRDHKSPIVN